MQSIPAKSDSTAGANGVLPASEYNDRNVEIEKVITRSGQALSAIITDQFSKAIFINAIGAASMIDSGAGNTITLNPVTGGGGLVPPDSYTDFNGGVVCFNKATPNTLTAVTIAPWALTAKPLVRKDGSLPLAGDVIGECFCKWDNVADKWVLMRNETDTYKHFINSSIAFTPVFGKTLLEIDTNLGNRTVPIANGVFIGQEISVYTSGTGRSTMSGTGLYINGIVQTSNTGILKLKWNGTEWRADNVITADWVSGPLIIKQSSTGNSEIIIYQTGAANTAIAAYFGTTSGTVYQLLLANIPFAVAFTGVPSILTGADTVQTRSGYTTPTAIGSGGGAITAGNSSGQTVSAYFKYKGKY